jgi:K+-sensing histidine kinase KdpD
VETPDLERAAYDRSRDLQEVIEDAVDLGAEVVRIPAPDVVTGIEQAVRDKRATHIVLAHEEVKGLRRFTERPLAEQVLQRLPELEVHLVSARPRANGADQST